jgi:hypothetical protein
VAERGAMRAELAELRRADVPTLEEARARRKQ